MEVAILIILAIPIILATDNHYKVTPLNNRVGLYYNHIGDAKISNGKFTLLTHFDLESMSKRFDQINKFYTRSNVLCFHLRDSYSYNHVVFYCNNTLQLAKSGIDNIHMKIESITHLTGHELESLRKKRGLLNGISYAVNWLFGIPDADDAKYYDESIKSLLNANKNTQLLMKQQIAVVSNAIQNFNASVINLKINEEKFNENLKKFNHFSNQTTSAINELRLQRVIADQLHLLSKLVSKLDNYCDLLIESITLARHNILHPNIITPFQLLQELSHVTLKSGQQLPYHLGYNTINKYFDLKQLSVVYINNNIIFAIKIPLVNEVSYILYELLPLPIPHLNNDLHSFIEPSFPYLLISDTKVYYSPLKDLKKCTPLEFSSYICNDVTTIRTTEKPTCETLLLTSTLQKIPEICVTKTIQAHVELWHNLFDNSWLFALSKNTLMTLSCNKTIEDISLADTGLLELTPGCTAYSNSYVLQTSSEVKRKFIHKSPEFSITTDDCCLTNSRNITLPNIQLTPMKLNNIRLNELNLANHKLQQLDDLLQKQLENPTEYHHSSWFRHLMTIIATVIIILIIMCICKRCGCYKYMKNHLKNEKKCKDLCCLKIFNTNISAPPVTKRQLEKMIEDDEEEAIEIPLRTSYRPTQRRSLSKEPTIIME